MLGWSWWLASNEINRGEMYPSPCIEPNEGNIY